MKRLIAMVLLLAVLVPVELRAQGGTENKLLALMPELRKMPGPEWLKEGLRVTYHTAAATVAAERFYWYKDNKGDWQRGDEVGPAGAGMTQYQVVVRSETGVVGVLENYMQDPTSGITVPAHAGGMMDPAGAGACWANPAALAKAERFQSRDLLVMKAPYPVGGKTYNSIRFHYVSDSAVRDEVYDLDSGLLLFSGSAVLSGDRRYTQLAQTTYVARRQVKLPAAPAAPEWMAEARQLRYQGAIVVHMPGMPQFPMPTSVTLRKTGGGARWASYEATQQSQGQMPSTVTIYCGASQLNGEPWMAPALLAGLQTGQVVDEDPQLRVVTRVERVCPGPGGAEMVVLAEEGQGFKRLRGYDRQSGKLLMMDSLQQVGGSVQETQLQLVGG